MAHFSYLLLKKVSSFKSASIMHQYLSVAFFIFKEMFSFFTKNVSNFIKNQKIVHSLFTISVGFTNVAPVQLSYFFGYFLGTFLGTFTSFLSFLHGFTLKMSKSILAIKNPRKHCFSAFPRLSSVGAPERNRTSAPGSGDRCSIH